MSSKPWYPVPFQEGQEYVALADIPGHFDRIKKGERLIYRKTGFSRYDHYLGFFFTDSNNADRRWDIYDDMDPIAEAEKVFVRSAPATQSLPLKPDISNREKLWSFRRLMIVLIFIMLAWWFVAYTTEKRSIAYGPWNNTMFMIGRMRELITPEHVASKMGPSSPRDESGFLRTDWKFEDSFTQSRPHR